MLNASLRTRLVVGAFLWTIGLLAASAVTNTVVHYRSGYLKTLHGSCLALLAVLCLAGGFGQLRAALLSFERLRRRLGAVREGREARVAGVWPSEVAPMVDDLNALLAEKERMVARAEAQAGDLAHGLKTPLAVLALEAERLEAEGNAETARTLAHQVARMREEVEHRLAQTRAGAAAAAGGPPCAVADVIGRLVRTMNTLHARRGLELRVDAPAAHGFRGGSRDLEEMVGNLLDNACKWARSRVDVATSLDGATLVVTIADDGPGVPEPERARVLERGTRADEETPGSGLGLAIVREYAALYGGSIALARADEGGLLATLTLPRGVSLPG